ncbi:hypothetical protein [Gemmatimonas sp.]|jgi:hypothetical protein|uniref:hypothetical protein n=1 Tax=Gemmatimonas sp. TaxID=1962908 RepID=UPI0022C9D6EB|nr:hypothetical protein [Gemmatimonas sp.]MCZ8206446.1 hypothetical protein [Gemmatimonas sp.]
MRLIFAALPLCLLTSACASGASSREEVSSPAAVVAQLYHDYAWEVVLDDARAWATLTDEPRDVLMQYFDDRLVDLLEEDQRCRERTKQICTLDGSPIWYSNDPEATRLTVAGGADSTEIAVSFTRSQPPSEGAIISLTYRMARTPRGWRVHDVRFPGGRSLVELLSAP